MIQSQAIVDDLLKRVEGRPVWLAYSGGVDSHVLLHILASKVEQFNTLHVVHVDHQLQESSSYWAEQCQQTCECYSLPFHLIKADVRDIAGLGLEAAARKARYTEIQKLLPANAVLVTAQHQNDQAETLLLQLLRGAGPKGLAAMAKQGFIHGIEIIRPLLETSQADILGYAETHQLSWLEDPSNLNTDINRNYIRHSVWPIIEARWPSAAHTLSRSSRLCAETDELLTELAEQDLAAIVETGFIQIDRFLTLSLARQRNCLRFYIQHKSLVLPSETILQQIIDTVCLSSKDATPKVTWLNYEAIRFQNLLLIQQQTLMPSNKEYYFSNHLEPIILNEEEQIEWVKAEHGIKKALLDKGLKVGFRQGGEKIQLAGKHHHQSLKKLFQEWQVPTWKRDRIPLLFDGDALIAVVGYEISQQAIAEANQQAFKPILKQR